MHLKLCLFKGTQNMHLFGAHWRVYVRARSKQNMAGDCVLGMIHSIAHKTLSVIADMPVLTVGIVQLPALLMHTSRIPNITP